MQDIREKPLKFQTEKKKEEPRQRKYRTPNKQKPINIQSRQYFASMKQEQDATKRKYQKGGQAFRNYTLRAK